MIAQQKNVSAAAPRPTSSARTTGRSSSCSPEAGRVGTESQRKVLTLSVARCSEPSKKYHLPPVQDGAAERQALDRRRVTWVIDGDTLELERTERVRLVGIDCPELNEPLGPVIAEWVRERVEDRLVRLSFDPATVISGHRDVFGRTLAYVWLPNGQLLNREIVALGHGTVDLRYPCLWTPSLLEAARAACRRRLGVWQPASPHRCVARTRWR